MGENNEQKWPQDDGNVVRYTKNKAERPDERQIDDLDDTIRYGDDWHEDDYANVQSHRPDPVNRALDRDDMQDSEDSDLASATQKQDWKPDEVNSAARSPSARRSEQSVHEEAVQRLYDDRRVDASNVYVDVNQGSVRLWGAVASQQEKEAAEEIVRGIAGVEVVQNELQIMQNKPAHTGGPEKQTRPD